VDVQETVNGVFPVKAMNCCKTRTDKNPRMAYTGTPWKCHALAWLSSPQAWLVEWAMENGSNTMKKDMRNILEKLYG